MNNLGLINWKIHDSNHMMRLLSSIAELKSYDRKENLPVIGGQVAYHFGYRVLYFVP